MKQLTQPGEHHAGFRLENLTDLPHLNCRMFELTHGATGARMIHLESRDDNNLFAVGFRTPPDDSTGVAHILEHTALCGSKRFPVRDPFFSMLKRSLNSFMNAMTASDWTLYPFSSQNRKDYENLREIYLDAAFFPLLRERDFLQEGHRIEPEDLESPESPLTYKGVVYNEMKGAMADPSSLISRRLSKALYPTTTYGFNSGGEPTDIPRLTHDQLRDFHSRLYHPSNAYFFTYGNFPLEEQLEVIEERVLRHFDQQEPDSAVPPEKRFEAPRQVTETYPLEPGQPMEGKSMVQVGWLCCDINDTRERLALSLVSSLLLGNPAAPLYKALLDSKLGSNLAPGGGYQDDNRTTCFAAGLQGTDPDKAEAIEALILRTLGEVAEEGFAPERVDAAIHRMEFSNREITGDSYPFGLLLLMRLIGPWIHGGSPVQALQFSKQLQEIREASRQGPYLEGLIRRHFLENPHRVRLTLRPDPTQEEREARESRTRLEQLERTLTAEDRNQILARAKELEKAQDAEEDLGCLPSLELKDIPQKEPDVPALNREAFPKQPLWFDQPTNGILYLNLQLDPNRLSSEQRPYAPLFCAMLPQVGAAGKDYLETARRIEAHTGGIRLNTSVLESPQSTDAPIPLISFKAKALVEKLEPMSQLIEDLLLTPDFSDLERLHTVLGQLRISLENSIPSSGHSYAARHAAGGLTPGAALRESWSGLEQIRFIRELASRPADELKELASTLEEIGRTLFVRPHLAVALTVEKQHRESIAPRVEKLLARIPEGPASPAGSEEFHPRHLCRGWAASVPVSYVSCVLATVPFEHPDSAPLQVLAKLLKSGFLHREIREKGGAYGGMASYDSEAGLFSMLSYRDPHLERTLEVYRKAVDWAVKGEFSDEAIKEAILALFSDLDRPLSPGGKGANEFANIRQGMSLEMRNMHRQRLLAVDRDSLVRVAGTYLRDGWDGRSVTVISAEEKLRKAQPIPFEIRRI